MHAARPPQPTWPHPKTQGRSLEHVGSQPGNIWGRSLRRAVQPTPPPARVTFGADDANAAIRAWASSSSAKAAYGFGFVDAAALVPFSEAGPPFLWEQCVLWIV